jgi:FtsZ-binding cell division protein ZapB
LIDLYSKLKDFQSIDKKSIIVNEIKNVNHVNDMDVMIKLSNFLTNARIGNDEYIKILQIENIQLKETNKNLIETNKDLKKTIEFLDNTSSSVSLDSHGLRP